MPANFTELTRVQIPALLHLERLGYKFVHRDSLNPEPQSNILTDVFKGAVKNLNISPQTVECYRRNLEQLQRAWEETVRFNRGFFFPVNADDLRNNWSAECFCRGGLLQ